MSSAIDSRPRVTASIASVIESVTFLSQLTPMQSSDPVTLSIDTKTRAIDTETTVS
jgi:ACT domain-containing protein